MKVLFLGTGSAEGLPALFCECEVCVEARRRGGKDRRTRSTILVDETIKIDLPPDTLYHVHVYPEVCFSRLEHLLFTHSHDDHFAVRELQYLSPNFAPSRKNPLHIWATPELLEKIRKDTCHFFEPAPLNACAIQPFQEYAVGHLAITPILAHHRDDEVCVNYLLRSPEGRTLLYACDTGWYDEPTWEFLTRVRLDAMVLECGLGIAQGGYEGHLTMEECIRIKERLHRSDSLPLGAPFYLTHIAHTGLLLHEELSERVAPHGITVAHDGLEIHI